MKSIRDSCIEFFQDENIKRDLRDISKPIINAIYDEFNIYLWIVVIYSIFLIFIILANLFILLRLLRYSNKVSYID
jgi:hypothetical protein